MSLCCFDVTLSDVKEAGGGAVAALSFVVVVSWAVEVVKGVLVHSTTLAADN